MTIKQLYDPHKTYFVQVDGELYTFAHEYDADNFSDNALLEAEELEQPAEILTGRIYTHCSINQRREVNLLDELNKRLQEQAYVS